MPKTFLSSTSMDHRPLNRLLLQRFLTSATASVKVYSNSDAILIRLMLGTNRTFPLQDSTSATTFNVELEIEQRNVNDYAIIIMIIIIMIIVLSVVRVWKLHVSTITKPI